SFPSVLSLPRRCMLGVTISRPVRQAVSTLPIVASGGEARADELLDLPDHLVDLERRRIDLDRIGGGPHPHGVALVALAEVGRERVRADVRALGLTAARAH